MSITPGPDASRAGPHRRLVTAVVVTWNSAVLLRGLLDTLDKGPAGVAWHLIVADNASDDDTMGVLRRCAPAARLIQTGHNGGYAAGINAALAATRDYRYVLMMNPDVRLHPGCVAAMLAEFDRPVLTAASRSRRRDRVPRDRARIGIVVAKTHDRTGDLILSLHREPTILRALGAAALGDRLAGRWPLLGEMIVHEQCYFEHTTADWAIGSLMLLSRECLDECGPLDEAFFLYSEETEFCLRARDHGFLTVLAPDAEALHLEGQSQSSPQLWALLTINRVRLYRRRHGLPATAGFWLAVLLRELSRATLGRRTSRRAAANLLRPSRWGRPPSA